MAELALAPALVADPVDLPGLRLSVEPVPALAKLSCWAGAEPPFAWAAGRAWPGVLREVVAGDLSCAWLAPGEWLLAGPAAAVGRVLAAARQVPEGAGPLLALDLTHGLVVLRVEGVRARLVLAALCPLDLHETAFPEGSAATSLLAGEPGLVTRRAGGFRLVADQAHGRTLWERLLLAAEAGDGGLP